MEFLYLLMRDELACGVVADIVKNRMAEPASSFTNVHLEAYAREIAEKLTD